MQSLRLLLEMIQLSSLTETYSITLCTRRVWRYQRCNQNPYIAEEHTTQWSKEKAQKNKQRSTNHTHKTKDWVTQTSLKLGGECRCYGRIVKCLRQVEHIRGHLLHRYSTTVNQVMVATVKLSKWWLQLNQKEPLVQ